MEFKLRANARYVSNEDLLADLRQAAKCLGKNTIGQREYLKIGKFSCKPFINRFGSWNLAIEKANLERVKETKVSNELLFESLEQIWLHLGRQPFYGEMRKPLSKYTMKIYLNRFGSWMKACEAFIKYKKTSPEFVRLFKPTSTAKHRSINEKLRLQVFKRDNYACRICGKSPATHRGVVLHVDHNIPFSKGGDNSLTNLRTLCNKCNLGRGSDVTL